MQFYFVRHGQSENNLLWARTGSSLGRSEDPALTPVGRQQAQRVAQFLCGAEPAEVGDVPEWVVQNLDGFNITHLYTSLMIRAVATGTAIAQALGLPLAGWKDLHETGGIFFRNEDSGEQVKQGPAERAQVRRIQRSLLRHQVE